MLSETEERDQAVRVQARLDKAAQLERDRETAWAEIAADQRRANENIVRLRALRHAKEEADAAAAALVPKKPVKRTKVVRP